MFNKVLIANRGAIACRIIKTLNKLGITSVAIYSEADAQSLHVVQADEGYSLGEGGASATYLHQQQIIDIAKQCGAQAIHPGYGFLSENPEFVQLCEENDIVFLGPTPEQMRVFGLKHSARQLAQDAGVPLLPGTPLLADKQQALDAAESIGFPVMLKSTAGGGGIGMQCCHDAATLASAFESVKRLSQNNFSNSGVFLEKFIEHARHIEVQIFGNGQGEVVALGERDCSAQRRNQKVIEETPAPHLSEAIRQAMQETAIRLAQQIDYRNAGTVEFVFDQHTQDFYFLEVNTRLQVEHGVTEEVFAVDLVEWMIRLGAQELSNDELLQPRQPKGHAIQVRLYAEDANKAFQPCAGLLSHVQWPTIDGLRVEHWIEAGVEVSPYFDPMLAKLIVHADDRDCALDTLRQSLAQTTVYGIEHNQAYLQQLLNFDVVQRGEVLTRSLNDFIYQPHTLDVLSGGTQTTIQDFPGRKGYWHVGVPPSGPMDSLSFCYGNQLLNNDARCAGLEMIISGPTLKFNCSKQFVVTGAEIETTLDGEPLEHGVVHVAHCGQTLKLGKVTGHGTRSYLLIEEGLQCPEYLGSKSTFTLGQFGGHGGRALCAGDVLHVTERASQGERVGISGQAPAIEKVWDIRVMYGPHGAPDFFTEEDIREFFAATWQVHFNSSRTGVRLIGPKPNWARQDGGEAGLHPSNIHDNAYAVGTIDFTGDMPVILGPDGPSLGGFVCPVTIIKADLWKMGQLKAEDNVRFIPVSLEQAEHAERQQNEQLTSLAIHNIPLEPYEYTTAVVHTLSAKAVGENVVYRSSGEDYLLIEYGPQVLDIRLRFRVHALMLKLESMAIDGIAELTPGIRSLQVHFDNLTLSRAKLLAILEKLEYEMEDIDKLSVPARIVNVPLSWDDHATRLAIRKYDELVRKDAPWCPDNIEFIRRINGLDSVDDVKKMVFEASYLVMGLGDVYLGAPVATPMDPRHRLVTTKYNPARTWTPENAVGIGGAYLCVYGMEGPGGYQFVGRTLQMWNRYRQTKAFQKPWLLRFFDQIRFYEVSAKELLDIREKHPLGQFPIEIEETTFSLADYDALVSEHGDEIQRCKQRQQMAFEEERQRWIESGQANFVVDDTLAEPMEGIELADGESLVESQVAGNIWQVIATPGQVVKAGDVVMILEAMKMELEVVAPCDGQVSQLCSEQGSQVKAGQPLMVINEYANSVEEV